MSTAGIQTVMLAVAAVGLLVVAFASIGALITLAKNRHRGTDATATETISANLDRVDTEDGPR